MSEQTPNLNLPYIMPNQAQKHVTHNEAIRMLDALVHLAVASRSRVAPPASPANGSRYIVAPEATGDWAGWDASIAVAADGGWMRLVPEAGWQAWVQDEGQMLVWSGSAWIAVNGSSSSGAEIQNAERFGLGTTADATNRFAAKLNAALWTALSTAEGGTGSLVATFNKTGAGKDAGLALQTGFSARALLGLFGNDDFTVKVSADGASFRQALAIGRATGNVAIGTDADANNRLLVSGQNALFTNAGPLNVVMNKGNPSDDLSFALQSGFATQALLGLLANNDFTIKVGTAFRTALVIDNATGAVSLPQNPKFSASATQDQTIPADSWTPITFDNVRHNVGGAYNPATGTFTAPSDGVYLFGANAVYKETGSKPSMMFIGFSINGGTPTNDRLNRIGDQDLVSLKTSAAINSQLLLTAGDKIAIMVRYNTSNSLTSGTNTCFFWGTRLS